MDASLLEKAFRFSEKAHEKQQRASGEHYFSHCAAVADALLEFKLDLPTIAAGLLHDVLEDTPHTAEDLRVGALTTADLTQVVSGSARVAEIELEPGLAAAMVADTDIDLLTGGGGSDWFFKAGNDQAKDGTNLNGDRVTLI